MSENVTFEQAREEVLKMTRDGDFTIEERTGVAACKLND
jgi:hypothetical protein